LNPYTISATCFSSDNDVNTYLGCNSHGNDTGMASLGTAVEHFCSSTCLAVFKTFNDCLSSDQDKQTLTRIQDAVCLKDPNDSSKICLSERIALLTSKSIDVSTLEQNLPAPIDCNSCTKAAMKNLLDNSNYFFSGSKSTNATTATTLAEANIQQNCGTTYDKLGQSDSTSTANSGLPVYAIVLIVLVCVVALALFTCLLYKRIKSKKQKMASRDSQDPLTSEQGTYYDNKRTSDIPPPSVPYDLTLLDKMRITSYE